MISNAKFDGNGIALLHEPFDDLNLQGTIPWADISLGVKTGI